MGKPNLLNELDIELAPNTVGELELSAVKRVFQSGKISSGLETIKLENEFSDLVCGRACVAMNSGTAALYSSLKVLGVSAGDEVIVPAFTFVGTANAVALTGATPVFVDIDPQTFCIDPQAVEAAITPRTVAVSEYLKFISPIVKGKLDVEIRAAQLEGDLINSRQQLAASEALLHESEKTWQSVGRTRGWKVLNMIWSLKQRLSFKRSRGSTNGTL
jgi:hypothetical protein